MTVLDKRDWEKFVKRVQAEENIKVPLVPTPKLSEADEMVRFYVRGNLNGHNNTAIHR